MRVFRQIMKYLLVVFFVFGGINHFRVPDFYINIMPDYLPWRAQLVALSGATEILAGIMLAIPPISRWGAWFIIAHLAVFMTVHVHMLVHADRYADVPLALLWARIPLQVVLVLWASWFTGKEESDAPTEPEPGTA